MCDKIFWENPYLTELETVVADVSGPNVELQSTIFFAFSGGQESDAGEIGGYPVVTAEKAGATIVYQLSEDHALNPGDKVKVTIDWDRRYRLMKLHFAAELVLELCYSRFPGIDKIGAHISEDKARLDFLWSENVSHMFPAILSEVRSLVNSNRKIKSAFSDAENEKRFWEIEGFSKVPCGGTHLRETGEIGDISLKRVNIGKGKERIEIYLV